MKTSDQLAAAAAHPAPKRPWFTGLGAQVGIAMILGIVVGFAAPGFAVSMKILGDIFLALIKAGVAPLIFFTIVMGIASAGDVKKASRIGFLALIYLEIVSTVALVIGLLAGNLFGIGIGVQVPASDAKTPTGTMPHGFVEFLTAMVPDNFVGAFTGGALLQVVVLSVIFGCGLLTLKAETLAKVNAGLDVVSQTFFGFINIVMRLAPIGAFGAIAYSVGSSGTSMLIALGQLILEYWVTVALFVTIVLGGIAALAGFNLLKILRYLKLEAGIVLSTASSEPAVPGLLDKLPRLGLSRQVVGLVIPTGYAFNLDGTSIYMAICTLFLAHVYNILMPLSTQVGLLLIMLLTSKGAATVSGGTFVVFAATVAATGYLPTAGLPVLFGVYRFMSMATAFTNVFGNVVATLVVARLTKEVDMDVARRVLADPTLALQDAAVTPHHLSHESPELLAQATEGRVSGTASPAGPAASLPATAARRS